MKQRFKELLKGFFLTSVSSLINSNDVNAIPYSLNGSDTDNNCSIAQEQEDGLWTMYTKYKGQ